MVKLGKKEITFDKAQKQAFAESCITLFLTTICLNLKDARMCNILFNKETGEMNFIDPIFPWESRINRMVDFNDGEYKATKSPLLALFDIFYETSTGNIKNGSNTEGRMKNLYGHLFKTVESALKGDGKIIFQKLELIKEKLQENIENPAIGELVQEMLARTEKLKQFMGNAQEIENKRNRRNCGVQMVRSTQ